MGKAAEGEEELVGDVALPARLGLVSAAGNDVPKEAGQAAVDQGNDGGRQDALNDTPCGWAGVQAVLEDGLYQAEVGEIGGHEDIRGPSKRRSTGRPRSC